MSICKSLFLVLAISAASTCFAGERDQAVSTTSGDAQTEAAATIDPSLTGYPSSTGYPNWAADTRRDVCYTIRAYRVKRTERLIDGHTANRGYSKCVMATDYTLRTTVEHPRDVRTAASPNN